MELRRSTNGKVTHVTYVNYLLTASVFRKKMNFTTDLPKRNPLVSYIVASAVRCAKLFPETVSKTGPPVYRMHAVILKVPPRSPDDLTPRR